MMHIEKTIEALRAHNMDVYLAKDKGEAKKIALSLIPEGATCASGGSVTLDETGIIEELKSGKYVYIDRYIPTLTPEERVAAMKRALTADYYFMSANAITENGELYNVDGNSNRVAALLYGTGSVIVVAGKNKIVKDLEAAILRVKTVAAPKNAARLNCATPCAKTGHCISLDRGGDMADGCSSPARICCNFVVSAQQRHPSRIKVILVDEELGY
jgi:L-lactate utilization protein LutB